jgi:hypothetical protein
MRPSFDREQVVNVIHEAVRVHFGDLPLVPEGDAGIVED